MRRHRECAALDASLAALRWAPEQDLLQAECYFAQADSPLTWSQRSRPSQSRPRLALCADSAADLRTGPAAATSDVHKRAIDVRNDDGIALKKLKNQLPRWVLLVQRRWPSSGTSTHADSTCGLRPVAGVPYRRRRLSPFRCRPPLAVQLLWRRPSGQDRSAAPRVISVNQRSRRRAPPDLPLQLRPSFQNLGSKRAQLGNLARCPNTWLPSVSPASRQAVSAYEAEVIRETPFWADRSY